MGKRLKAICLCLLLAHSWRASAMPRPAMERPEPPVLRALLVVCDEFESQPDTAPSSYNNAVRLRRALLHDVRGYQRIRVVHNRALTAADFDALVEEAFLDAGPYDQSLVYIATHGLLEQGEQGDGFAALFSDGEQEHVVSAGQIRDSLVKVKGQVVLLLDACFSGAAIHKGMDAPLVSSAFTGTRIKVLTSAGGHEPSFLWTDGLGRSQGGSYFAEALIDGISWRGLFAADVNRDGLITLLELFAHQRKHYGASTPMVYPENDSTVVFAYSPGQREGEIRPITHLDFDARTIDREDDLLSFSYTLHREERLAYQLVYMQDGVWRFHQPQSITVMGDMDGLIRPGRKQEALRLLPGQQPTSGYLLLFLLTVVEDRSFPQACVLISAQPVLDKESLALESAASFAPASGEEAAFVLRHQGALQLSARVVNEQGAAVMQLLYEEQSRPLHLSREGTSIYWNGRQENGDLAPAGRYRLEVEVSAGDGRESLLSEWFELK